ncbi:MAG: sulfatase-like hydrolase/transferase, partial [Rufibacter sp.]
MRILKRRVALVLVGALLSAQAVGQAKKPSAAPNKKQPNIIFIMTDDLGYGDLGVLFQKQRQKKNDRSEPWAYTPNLDKMADQGAILNSHYAAAPVCAPSRASFMLGQSQGHANVRDNQFDKAIDDNYTVANMLKKVGYATAAIGKWGLQGKTKDEWPAHPLNRGFDYYYGYMRHGDGHEHYPVEGVYRGPKEVYENRKEVSAGLAKCYTADLWTAATKKWIVDHAKGQSKENPFFIYLAYDTPHAVLELPTQEYPAGGGLKGGLQWTGKPGQMINTASGTVDSWIHPDYAKATYDHDKNPSTPEVAWPNVYQRYATSVRRIDDAVGDLLQLLRDLKIDENTLVVFTSDNGPSLESYLEKVKNDPDFFNSFGPFDGVKRDVLEGGVRMPALAWW